jgi:hypothetical protein
MYAIELSGLMGLQVPEAALSIKQKPLKEWNLVTFRPFVMIESLIKV